ncbi:MAG TPA: recombinase family protein [Actinophytocola sp.]|uniref:recombinase family protein n=1 Tax=Actinophytocola sp. TaxID=1872138 RepID=UPI002DDCCBFA|nr:recombinase family protein [Actinophytocola sp.]HEV2780199.1 recombinase family protein [Actinophytocola sp.]
MEPCDTDLLVGWVRDQRRLTSLRLQRDRNGLRLAFYGRTSTVDFQDRASSQAWQREVAECVVAGRGEIVVEFFDAGYSRRLPWADRPEAAALLAALADPGRAFDAIVVGEYERAFFGDQLQQLLPLFHRHRVQLWLPETNGPLDLTDPAHRALLLMLGAQSRREVLRARHRVLSAMRAQVLEQGRHLGGRPPYGYRLVDAGPHPNRAHAMWGRRLHRLDLDPVTAPQVRWIFAQRLAGMSVASIARRLNERGVPCPSQADRRRNPHRHRGIWTVHTVASILANPRYTGRQVWNRQSTDPVARPGRVGRRRVVQRWNPIHEWVISKMIAHPPLVTERDFVAVQNIHAARPTQDGRFRRYQLAGLIRCGLCGRRMDAHWVHDRAGYRCRHGHTTGHPRQPGQAKNVYQREDHILAAISTRLAALGIDQAPPGTDAGTSHHPTRLAELLRTHRMTIVCDHTGWALTPNLPTTSGRSHEIMIA